MRRFTHRLLCAAAASAAPPIERAIEEYDVVVVGGGPAGLSAAIKLKELAAAANGGDASNFRVALIEKGSTIGAHTLSGACIQPNALEELFPNWKELGAPLNTPVVEDHFYCLKEKTAMQVPFLPPTLHNHGNYIVSLGEVCKWMGEQAEKMGVEIFCGFAGSQPVFEGDAALGGSETAGKTSAGGSASTGSGLVGIQLNDVGINKKGKMTDQFQPGMILKGRQIILAEGCRGSLTKVMEAKYGLRKERGQIQSYGLGMKEVWEVPADKFKSGRINHTCGWPTTDVGHDNTYAGSFLYDWGSNLLSIGFVVGLDYSNPHIRPYMEFQKWKTHPFVSDRLKGGKPLSYGARTLIEGGFTSLPKLSFPGGVLVGDCAGFLNLPKIKGTHTAMKSGILAAEAIWESGFKAGKGGVDGDMPRPEFGKHESKCYEDRFRGSWLYTELYAIRNVRQMFAKNFWAGVLYTGFTTTISKGHEPFTLKHQHHDHECLKPASQCTPISYPKPDGVITFDLLTNHSRSGTNHNGDQPSHLKLKDYYVMKNVNENVYASPETKYCPAGVYELVDDEAAVKEGKPPGTKKLRINAQNCLHCKACDIKDVTQNINWTTPEGGGGPNYNASM